MASQIAAEKSALRRRMREVWASLDPGQVAEWSTLINDRVVALPAVRSARVVHTFIGALPGEVETRALAEALLREGKRVVCPRVLFGKAELEHYEVGALDELIESGMGLWEPDPDRCRPVPVAELDVVLTPGLAFDRRGQRLGLGRGYYDRLLASSRATPVGLGFGVQLVAEVPRESHDQALDWIVTELAAAGGGVIDCRREREQ